MTSNDTDTSEMEQANTCDRCGDTYEPYAVFVPDDISALRRSQSCEWDNLCKPCRMHVADYGAYLTEEEREELSPKRNVDADGQAG